MELKTCIAALSCFCIFSVVTAPSAQSASEINGELEDECLAFLNWFEKTIRGAAIEGRYLEFHSRGIEGFLKCSIGAQTQINQNQMTLRVFVE